MKIIFIIGVFILGATTANSYEYKSSATFYTEVKPEALILGDFERDQSGKVIIPKNHYEAIKICKLKGKRLPTARELAIEYTKYGSELKEVSAFPSNEAAEASGFHLRRAKDITDYSSSIDKFYYSWKNYDGKNVGEAANYWVWASSLDPDYSNGINSRAFGIYGDDGSFYSGPRTGHVDPIDAVRCIQ